MFWTWDHATEWMLNQPGAKTYGSCNYYSRQRRGALKVTTPGCWSFAADTALTRSPCGVCCVTITAAWNRRSACATWPPKTACGLLCGVGLCCYGGVYYEGDSPYSLDLRLQKHPELKAFKVSGEPLEFGIPRYGRQKVLPRVPVPEGEPRIHRRVVAMAFQERALGRRADRSRRHRRLPMQVVQRAAASSDGGFFLGGLGVTPSHRNPGGP